MSITVYGWFAFEIDKNWFNQINLCVITVEYHLFSRLKSIHGNDSIGLLVSSFKTI